MGAILIVSLALQIAAVLCAVLAAAGPAISQRGVSEPGFAVLIDVSASMATEDMTDAEGLPESRVAAAARAAEIAWELSRPRHEKKG